MFNQTNVTVRQAPAYPQEIHITRPTDREDLEALRNLEKEFADRVLGTISYPHYGAKAVVWRAECIGRLNVRVKLQFPDGLLKTFDFSVEPDDLKYRLLPTSIITEVAKRICQEVSEHLAVALTRDAIVTHMPCGLGMGERK